MKLNIANKKIEELKELKENIENLLSICSNDMELTNKNIMNLDKAINKVNLIVLRTFNYGGIKMQIVSPEGTKLNIM